MFFSGGNVCQSFESVYVLTDKTTNRANLGWPYCEGPCGTAYWNSTCPCGRGYTDPWFSYSHYGTGVCQPTSPQVNAAITGGFVYRGATFPATYQGVYFYADYIRNYIAYIPIDANNNAMPPVPFDLAPTVSIVLLMQGPMVRPCTDIFFFLFSTYKCTFISLCSLCGM